jgi:serine/threonine protein kinase
VENPGASISKGFIPVGWYPTNIKVIGKKIFVSNGKGFSSMANPEGPSPYRPREQVNHQKGLLRRGEGCRIHHDEDRVRRLQQEARAASSLNHPNIVTIHEIGQADDRHFIATEYIDGLTLREYLKECQSQVAADGNRLGLQFSEVLSITMQVADALAAAHAKGIVHRDIKPENIMLVQDRTDAERAFVRSSISASPSSPNFRQRKRSRGDDEDLLNTREGSVIGTATICRGTGGEQVDADRRLSLGECSMKCD